MGRKVTGIPAKTIKELAEEYAKTEKAIIMGNAGLSHHTNGHLTQQGILLYARSNNRTFWQTLNGLWLW